jgi:hypothetical protein
MSSDAIKLTLARWLNFTKKRKDLAQVEKRQKFKDVETIARWFWTRRFVVETR